MEPTEGLGKFVMDRTNIRLAMAQISSLMYLGIIQLVFLALILFALLSLYLWSNGNSRSTGKALKAIEHDVSLIRQELSKGGQAGTAITETSTKMATGPDDLHRCIYELHARLVDIISLLEVDPDTTFRQILPQGRAQAAHARLQEALNQSAAAEHSQVKTSNKSEQSTGPRQEGASNTICDATESGTGASQPPAIGVPLGPPATTQSEAISRPHSQNLQDGGKEKGRANYTETLPPSFPLKLQ